MKEANILLSNWAALINICNINIEKRIEVEFFKSQKEKALAGYEEADKLFYQELAKGPGEIENGSYQADEDTRRFEMDEQNYLMELQNY